MSLVLVSFQKEVVMFFNKGSTGGFTQKNLGAHIIIPNGAFGHFSRAAPTTITALTGATCR
jgi:hypothetical protein